MHGINLTPITHRLVWIGERPRIETYRNSILVNSESFDEAMIFNDKIHFIRSDYEVDIISTVSTDAKEQIIEFCEEHKIPIEDTDVELPF